MRNLYALILTILLPAILSGVDAAQEDTSAQGNSTIVNTKKLFTYAGPLLPSDWTLVSTINDRAVIAFTNGSARNSLIDDLDPRDRSFVQRLQNGTVYSTPLSGAKEKIAQWSSTVTSTVSKFGKTFKDQFDSLINNKNKDLPTVNSTIIQ